MNNRDVVIEKFKVLLASIFPIEEVATPEVIEAEVEVPAEIKLKEVTLEDGTLITFESLEVDQPINVINADGTMSPLADGDYIIEDYNVTVVSGIIANVVEKPIETEAPEAVVIVEPVTMAEATPEDIEDLINGKVEEIKLAYESKLAAQKAEFEAQVESLGNKFKESSVIQAPIEVEKAPVSYKDRILSEIQSKRNYNKY